MAESLGETEGAMRFTANRILLCCALALPLRALADEPTAPAAPAPAPVRHEGTGDAAPGSVPASMKTIRLSGRLPFLDPAEKVDDELDMEFVLYASPLGGKVLWTEKQHVVVRAGEADVKLGSVTPLPDDAFTRTFRFVAIKVNGGEELLPRWPIETCVRANGDADGADGYGHGADAPADLAEGAPVPEMKLAALPGRPGVEMDRSVRPATSWLEAAQAAARAGARLPTAEEWLAAFNARDAAGFGRMTGHYEWVQPFVFSHASKVSNIAAYAGKLNGCSSEELSPSLNKFPYRIVKDVAAPAAKR
jgi:hypothetical protein